MAGLTEALAAMDDDRLRHLLAVRPDLAAASSSFGVLANRAQMAPSIQACLTHVDRFGLELLELLCAAGGTATVAELRRIAGGAVPVAAIDHAVDDLAGLALAWRDGATVHTTGALRQVFPYPFGLGRAVHALHGSTTVGQLTTALTKLGVTPPKRKTELLDALAAVLGDPKHMAALRKEAPPDARRIIDAVVEQRRPIVHANYDVYYQPRGTASGARWLHERGLLVQTSWHQFEMPGEAVRALRGDLGIELHLAPSLDAVPVDQESVDRAGAEAGTLLVDQVAALLDEWEQRPAAELKSGGVGVRDVRRTAKALAIDERDLFMVVELAAAADLIGSDSTLAGATIRLTGAADEWRAGSRAQRWLALIDGWLSVPRSPSLAGLDDQKAKAIPALHPGDTHAYAVPRRMAVLATLLRNTEPGLALEYLALAAWVEHRSPRLWAGGPSLPQGMIAWTIEEAERVGVVARGALTTIGRRLLLNDDATAAAEDLLPREVAEFTLQADLTAVVPGRLAPALAAELALVADVESTGAATVLRFSESSVRRALDAGRSAAQLTSFLEQHASRGVPQPLSYLIADIARRHGELRVGQAAGFVRSDDPALLAEVLRSRRTAGLGLRQIAPTVLTSAKPPAALIEGLRAAGYLPVEEGANGAVVTRTPKPARAPAPRRHAFAPIYPMVDVEQLEAAVRNLRTAPSPKKQTAAKGRAPAQEKLATVTDILSRLHPEIGDEEPDVVEDLIDLLDDAEGVSLEIGYVNSRGDYQEMIIEPVEVGPRFMTAAVLPSYKEQTFTIDRIQWARPVEPEEAWRR